MKLFNNKQDEGIVTHIVDRELSSYIQEKHLEHVQKHRKTSQKLSVIKFSELPTTAKISDYISGLTLDYQELVNYCNTRLNGKLHEARGSNEAQNMQDVMEQLQEDIDKKQDEINIVRANFDDQGKCHRAPVRTWQKVLWVLYFLAGFELLSNLEVYGLLGGGILASASIAIISGFIVFYWAHITAKYLHKFKLILWWKQVGFFTLMSIPILVVFSLFSQMRMEYIQMLNPDLETVFSSNSIVLLLTNYLAYCIATYLVFEYRPPEQVRNAYKKYCMDVKEIERLEKEKRAFVEENNALEPRLRQKLLEYKNILLLGQQTENDIQTKLENCFHEFKSELFLLTNGRCNPLFSGKLAKDLPPLQFNYQNIDAQLQS